MGNAFGAMERLLSTAGIISVPLRGATGWAAAAGEGLIESASTNANGAWPCNGALCPAKAVGPVAVTARVRENSDVFPAGSVAVAEMTWPGITDTASVAVKLALPVLFVRALTNPRN